MSVGAVRGEGRASERVWGPARVFPPEESTEGAVLPCKHVDTSHRVQAFFRIRRTGSSFWATSYES